MPETLFESHVFDGTSEPNQTSTLRTPSLQRARSFIDDRVEMDAIFGYWIPAPSIAADWFSPKWSWCHKMIQTKSLGDNWIIAAMGWADAWFADAKNYAMIVAPASYTPKPNTCNKCRADVPADLNCCPECDTRLY